MEVYHNGEWHILCDDGWDLSDAQVVCRELGLGPATTVRHNFFFEQDLRHIVWLDDLQCVGTEWTIGNCSHKGWNVHSCTSYHVAGVECATG